MECKVNKNKVLIFETDYSGHRLICVKRLIEAYRSKGLDVVWVTTLSALNSREYKTILKGGIDEVREVKIFSIKNGLWGWKECFLAWKKLKEIANKEKPGLIFIPVLDKFFFKVSWLSPERDLSFSKETKIEGILFQGNVPEEKNIFKIKTSIKNFFLKSAINNNIFDRVLCMSELYYEFLRNKLEGENRKKVGLCPDPCETGKVFEVSEARKSLSLPQGAKIVGMVGTINKRKGADLLIKSFLERNHKDNEFILLAGKQTEDIKKLIRYCKSIFPEKIRHVIEINRFLSQEEFLLAIAAVDAVAVVYPAHFGSSGILIQAAAAKKPVLGSAFSWVGYAIKKYNLGYCCNVCEHAELTKGLEWAFGNPTFSVDGASMLVQQNTNEKFREVILENIRC